MSNTPEGTGARSPHHVCETTHSSVFEIVAHWSGRKWLASSSSSVEQTGEVVKAKRSARRRHWHCAAIWRLWSRNDLTWRVSRYNKRRRRRTLVVSSWDCPWSRRLLSQARVRKGHCTSDRYPTMVWAKYRTTRATSGIGGLGVASAMSHDGCLPVVASTHWAFGLLDAAVGLGFWTTVRTNCDRCAACEEPLFPRSTVPTTIRPHVRTNTTM